MITTSNNPSNSVLDVDPEDETIAFVITRARKNKAGIGVDSSHTPTPLEQQLELWESKLLSLSQEVKEINDVSTRRFEALEMMEMLTSLAKGKAAAPEVTSFQSMPVFTTRGILSSPRTQELGESSTQRPHFNGPRNMKIDITQFDGSNTSTRWVS
ncbi:conserved hypothetical protein [Ricinus communis]|uniref:Uncharacterized protein n=1 Tax=Ricinus communis TaxID=3988 RepID=B9S5E4_RICCO|nr:conserved hypothetical protein [Ricinus communis]